MNLKNLFSRLLRRGQKDAIPNSDEPEPPVASAVNSRASFLPVNELEQLLMNAATDQSARLAFERLLLTDDLLVATPEAPLKTEERTLKKSEKVQILNVADQNGHPIPAVFTSEERLAECFGFGTGYLAMNGEALFEILINDGATLNPGSLYGVRWTANNLAALLGKPVRRILKKDTKVLLGSPSERPEALIRMLTEALGSDQRIQAAWLALAHWPDKDDWSWYLDIRSDFAPDDIGPTIAEALATMDKPEKPVDVVVNKPSVGEGTGIRIKPERLQ